VSASRLLLVLKLLPTTTLGTMNDARGTVWRSALGRKKFVGCVRAKARRTDVDDIRRLAGGPVVGFARLKNQIEDVFSKSFK
jgi:hypothetical protein